MGQRNQTKSRNSPLFAPRKSIEQCIAYIPFAAPSCFTRSHLSRVGFLICPALHETELLGIFDAKMKLIQSRTQTLERENDSLKLQVEQLQEELQKYRELYRLAWKRSDHTPGISMDSATTAGSDKAIGSTKSYLRPTTASANRAALNQRESRAPLDLQESMNGASGSLVHDKVFIKESLGTANFLMSTESSRRREVEICNRIRPRLPNRTSWSQNDDLRAAAKSSDADSEACVASWQSTAEMKYTCIRCDELDRCDLLTGYECLKARSRLHDEAFYQLPASTCFIPFRVQSQVLRSALRLAQETLWSALRSHWPSLQRSLYLEGPEEVKFGRGELYRGFGNEDFPSEANEMCGQPRANVVLRVLDVVFLRNAVCHPGHRTTREVDRLLEQAQALAVVLQDGTRAFKIRKLRDELQNEATKAYEEIEAFTGLATLPFAKEWAMHHQRFFASVRCELQWSEYSGKYPEIAIQAAREWKLKHVSPGSLDPRYLANVERAKMYLRETGFGRRASVLAPFPLANTSSQSNTVDSEQPQVETVLW